MLVQEVNNACTGKSAQPNNFEMIYLMFISLNLR